MARRDLAFVFASALILGGCASTNQPSSGPGTGTGAAYEPLVDMQGVDAAMLASDTGFCRGEAAKIRVMPNRSERNDVADVVVIGLGMVVPFGMVSIALISSIASEMSGAGQPQPADPALQQKTLVNCMARKGYRNLDPNVTVAYVSRPTTETAAPPLPRNGRDTYVAEDYAKQKICEGPVKATLETKGPGFERYSVVCGNGQRVVLRCEFGNCRQEPLAIALGAPGQ